MSPFSLLRELFTRAVAVADPMVIVADHLPPRPAGRVVVVGAGKASARMAEAVEAAWGPCEGLVITRYGHARPCQGIEIVEAAHPVPDAAGAAATKRMLSLLADLGEDDFVLALISGGASALLYAPAQGLTLEDKKAVNAVLFASGAPIGEMNRVRKHLSHVKGGQLAAAAYPASMLCLMISDVPGDEPSIIGSGPTVGEASAPSTARDILGKWKIPISPQLDAALRQSTVVASADPRLASTENRVIAAPTQSIAAAAALAKAQGCEVIVLGTDLEGEARSVAHDQAQLALRHRAERPAGSPSLLLLSGGESTVTRTGDGTGGPNAEFCLALAIALDGAEGIYAIACDTDGVDGAAEVAGAVIGPETLAKAHAAGLDATAALTNNDAHSFFQAIGDQVITGPTLTNVNDFRAILIV